MKNAPEFHDQIVFSISALIVRVLGGLLIGYSLFGGVTAFYSFLYLSKHKKLFEELDTEMAGIAFLWPLIYSISALIIGGLFFIFSKKLGRLLAKGLAYPRFDLE